MNAAKTTFLMASLTVILVIIGKLIGETTGTIINNDQIVDKN